LPEEVGFRVGPDPDSIHYVLLETHYNNQEKLADLEDKSGIDLILTDKLRKYDAGIIILGDIYVTASPIPSGSVDYPIESECTSKCTSLWPHDITVIASFLHMHSYGISMYTILTRENSTEEIISNKIEYWDFGLQQYTPVNYVIHPGDRLNTVCLYNTRSTSSPVRFGPGSSDEMCMDFIIYYPKLKSPSGVDFAVCGSIGMQLQLDSNGTSSTVSQTPSTLCASFQDLGSIIDHTGKTTLNPAIPLPNRDIFNERQFGTIKPTEVCRPVPYDYSNSSTLPTFSFALMFCLSIIFVFFVQM